jgi:hypothetical protein
LAKDRSGCGVDLVEWELVLAEKEVLKDIEVGVIGLTKRDCSKRSKGGRRRVLIGV